MLVFCRPAAHNAFREQKRAVQTFISTEVSNEMHNMKKQALISCSDKSGVVEFAKALTELGYHILSTGGTAKLIAQAGIPVQEVADYTASGNC